MFGWQGKLLRIDLSNKQSHVEEIGEGLSDTLGGRGLALKIYTQEIDAKINPLSPENKIVLATGPLTGTGASSASVCAVVTKSAFNETVISAQIKLHFGAELKAAGYDALVIEGKADQPVLIAIKDEEVLFLPADFLLDKPTDEAESLFRLSFNDPWVARETRILHIGMAGQKQSPLASLITDGLSVTNSVGIGAVFGSKNVIGIAVRGTKDILVQEKDIFLKSITQNISKMSQKLDKFFKFSSYTPFEYYYQHNVLACNYFIEPFANQVTLDQIIASWERQRGCFSCPIACLRMKNGRFLPEIDAFMAIGPLCGIFDVSVISEIYLICTKLGLDAVETGFLLSCAMALKEKGLLKEDEIPNFGDKENILKLLPLIAEKKIKILEKGAFKLCESLNKPDFFLGIKGRGMVFDVRNNHFLSLFYATSTQGAVYFNGFSLLREIHEDIPQEVKSIQDKIAISESLGVCPYLFVTLPLDEVLSLFKTVTGICLNEEELLKKAEAVYQVERNFNEKVGFKKEDDMLPKRFLFPEFESMLNTYHQLRGW